ncbi:MAG: hypothetical protein OIF57_06750 [Marinobacterium sp.]|nr:hypothetical protein [Marinobacterium sp.]
MKITGAKGNVGVKREKVQQMLKKGEGLLGTDYWLEVEGWGQDNILSVSCQIPPMLREALETFLMYGQRIFQAGNINNAFEMPVTFKEVIDGTVYKHMRKHHLEKTYLKVTLKMAPESNPEGAESHKWVFHNCWFNIDGVDLSVEDRTSIVKPAGTMYGYFWGDEH